MFISNLRRISKLCLNCSGSA